jgi:hypothetical protein
MPWLDCVAVPSILLHLTRLDIHQAPQTMNSVFCCKDELRVFPELSGNALSMT